MHDAYEVVPLLKSTVQIESIAAYGENLLVGSKQGHLLMYSITPQPGDRKNDVQLLRYNKTFSRKPINQLEVVPEYDLLISLSDGIICVHDMKLFNFPIVCSIEKTKGASLFALDVKKLTALTGGTSVMLRMCVAVRRRLQLFYWKKDKFLDLREDLCLQEVPRSLAWCEEVIVAGFKSEYSLIEISGEITELFPIRPQEPSITKLSEHTFALGKDIQSIFMNNKGQPIHKLTIKWSEVPQALAYDEPYLVAVVGEVAEVRTIEPILKMQNLTLGKGVRMLVRCRQGQLYAASQGEVWSVQAVPLAQQVRRLLEAKQFELALKLTNISDESQEEKTQKIYEIQNLYAHDLFEKKQYSKSMSEFLKLGTDPYKVIQLFPDLVLKPGGNGGPDSPLLPISARVLEQDLEKALLALIEYLTEIRRNILGVNDLKTSDPSVKSRKNLIQIIDTTLLKCYLQTNDALIAPLLRLNRCHLGETEQMLKKFQKYRELIILYQTNGMHLYALKLLQEQSRLIDSPLYGTEHSIHYLQQLGNSHMDLILEHATWVLAQSPEDGLRIFIEDLQEVEQLPRPRVLDFLLRVQPALVIPYLEHVIKTWSETSDILHNALVHQYREKIQQVQQFLEKGENVSIELQALRLKLLKFLKTSLYYNPQVVIVQFPLDGMYEERAIVLGRMGMHENALSIYMSTLGNMEQAIKYCENVYEQNLEGADMVYVMLMRMLIDPPGDPFQEMAGRTVPPPKPDVERALEVLEKNPTKIQPLGALRVLPDGVKLSSIQMFLHSSLQSMLASRRRAQMLKGLLYAEHLQVQERRIQLQSQSLILTEHKICPVCKKKFSNQSAFARYPNGDIVHYSCQERRTTT